MERILVFNIKEADRGAGLDGSEAQMHRMGLEMRALKALADILGTIPAFLPRSSADASQVVCTPTGDAGRGQIDTVLVALKGLGIVPHGTQQND